MRTLKGALVLAEVTALARMRAGLHYVVLNLVPSRANECNTLRSDPNVHSGVRTK